MKKLLVLALVLSMATMASATLSTSSTLTGNDNVGSGAVSLSIVPGSPQTDDYMVITITGPGSLTSALGIDAPVDSMAQGTMFDMGLDTVYGNGDVYMMMSYASVYPTGVWITANYSGAVVGTVITAYETIDGSDWTSGVGGKVLGTITIVPEPITMTLLGLGGLFLRRRSK